MQLFDVLRRPLVTEKNTVLQASDKYCFEVSRDANKIQVKQAVEKAFKVTVISVNIMMVRGHDRRVGRRIVAESPWKKAVVTLKHGDKIQIFEGV
ncbi:MAG TPA: 50S ribosomal protein L23 [Dehalococcoidales bacterium]|nr:50S ribosomal protein L23 [Dehalococcoidales bacterium]